MKEVDIDFICKKAEIKKDGCYQIRGIAYRVRDARVTHLAQHGEVCELFGVFLVSVGKCSNYSEEALKFLRKIK